MSQTRLNNFMVLHVHKEHTDKLKDVADEFINTGRTFLENKNNN